MNKKGVNKRIIFFILFLGVIFIYYIFKRFALSNLSKILPINYTNTIENILIFLVLLILTYFFVNFSSRILKSYLITKGGKRDVKLIVSVYRYFVWFFIIFITLSLLFKQIGSLITSLGLIGFGITFALQKPILNFVGWITIVFSKTYKIGDIISINNLNGKVYDVKVMYTNLSELTQDGDTTGRSISIPNEFVLTTSIINYTKGSSYVWDILNIYLTYQSNWKKALKLAEKISQDYYDKNIKNKVKKMFKNEFKNYEKVITRVSIYDKGIIIKLRYLVDFDNANKIKAELTELLLEKLRSKDIIFGKIEDIKSDISF